MVKKFILNYFENFAYFYRQLRARVFWSVLLSILVGILDGFGLVMFLPLLQIVDGTSTASPEDMGNMGFLIRGIDNMGLELTLMLVLGTITFFFLFKGLANYYKGVYQVIVQQYFITKIRRDNLSSFKNLVYKYFITSDVGRIQNTLTGEVERVGKAYQSYFGAFQQGIMVAVYMGFAFLMDWKFAILVSIGGFLTNLIYKTIYKNTKGASVKLTGDLHKYQGLIIQAVANFKYLKASGNLKPYTEKLEDQVDFIEGTNRRIGILGTILSSSREPLAIVVVCIVIALQSYFIGSALSTIMVSLLFFYRALSSLMIMQLSWNMFLSVSGSLQNMTAFTKELKDNKEKPGSVMMDKFDSSIDMKNVNFNYGDKTILNNINLHISKNETVAFVGESGSGKTTLVNIISGLLPPDSGQMLIGGHDRTTLNIESYQKRIGYITQDPVIFNDTIFNNVTFWAEDTVENRVRYNEAVQKAAIADYIESLPYKDQTELGNNGVNLSGGQKQRISIARELYKDIDILILDEATSALDSDTEKEIQENIDSLKGTYTILIVAHRLSTIKNADRIILMSNGAIVNNGSFRQLFDNTPYFKRMVELQELS